MELDMEGMFPRVISINCGKGERILAEPVRMVFDKEIPKIPQKRQANFRYG